MKTRNQFLYWAPRMICIAAILFVSMFALDSFNEPVPFPRQILIFLVHLVPSFILAGILIVSWKWEFTGGIILILTGLLFGTWVFRINFTRLHSIIKALEIALMICLPFIISGILFIISHYRKPRLNRSSGQEFV